MPCANWACVVSTPPTSTALTRWAISSSVSRSPSSSASISFVIRSSRGSPLRFWIRASTYSTNSVDACSRVGSIVAILIGSNWPWIRFAQCPSCGASSSGEPITPAIIRAGNGFANASTKSHSPFSFTASQSFSSSWRMSGRSLSASFGVNACCTSLRCRRWSSPSRSSRLPFIRSHIGPSVTPCTSSIVMPGKVACGVRMKNATASWSSTIQPTGSARAIQDRSRSPCITSWNRGPVIVSSV